MIYDNYLQFYVFIVCFAFGAITGVLYEPISFLKGKYKNFKVWLAPDFLFCRRVFLSVSRFQRVYAYRAVFGYSCRKQKFALLLAKNI